MTICAAISIKAANDTSLAIKALWQQVGLLETQPSMQALGYPPHFTLAIYDRIDVGQVMSVASDVFRNCREVPVRFDRIRHFDAKPTVLWLEPSDLSELLALHEMVHSKVSPELCRTHYQPGHWVAHCTLGTNIRAESREAALKMVGPLNDPIEVMFDVGDCISFPPIEILGEYRLAPR